MNEKGNVRDRVIQVVAGQLGVEDTKTITLQNTLTDLGGDSLNSVEIVMSLEEEFKIDIPDEDADKLKSVGDVVKYIKDKMS